MKALLIAAAVCIVAFAGLFIALRAPAVRSDSVPLVTELPATPQPRAEEKPSAKPPEKNVTNAKGAKGQNSGPPHWQAGHKEPQPQRSKTYYTFVPTRRGGPIPDRVVLHNTSIGNITIILTDTDSDGRLYIKSGNYSHDKQQHPWEVRVVQGLLSVYWDGQDIPSGP